MNREGKLGSGLPSRDTPAPPSAASGDCRVSVCCRLGRAFRPAGHRAVVHRGPGQADADASSTGASVLVRPRPTANFVPLAGLLDESRRFFGPRPGPPVITEGAFRQSTNGRSTAGLVTWQPGCVLIERPFVSLRHRRGRCGDRFTRSGCRRRHVAAIPVRRRFLLGRCFRGAMKADAGSGQTDHGGSQAERQDQRPA